MTPPAEFEAIRAFVERVGGRAPVEGVAIATGDDAAQLADGAWPMVTIDTLVEGVHWRGAWSTLTDVGHKLLAVCASDVAAMGAEPGPFLLAASLPSPISPDSVTPIAEGIVSARADLGLGSAVVAIGGDVTRSPGPLVLTMTLFGRPLASDAWTRAGATTGDEVWVSGCLGRAAGGLALLEAGRERDWKALPAAHRRPRSRGDIAAALAGLDIVSACLDLSDGLAGDLAHMLEASAVGARVRLDWIPIDDATRGAAQALGVDPLQWALAGGEDFELLLAARPGHADVLQRLGCVCVGHIVEGRSLDYTDETGRLASPTFSGYVHR